MPITAIICGALLILTGVAGYGLSTPDHRSLTAFIPSFVGLLMLLAGIWGLASANARKHAMHAAAVIGLLGAILAAVGLGRAVATGGSMLSYATITAMFVICIVFVALCVRSFIAARSNRQSAPDEPSTG